MITKAWNRIGMFRRFSTEVKEAMIVTDDKSAMAEQEFSEWVNMEPKKKVNYRTEKRNAFYKLGFNPNHIPCQGNYEKTRKKKLP